MIRLPRDAVMIWGRHAAEAVLANPRRQITGLYLSPDAAEWLAEQHLATTLPDPVMMDKSALDQALAQTLAGEEKAVHQGIVIVARPLTPPDLETFLESPLGERPLVILLDQITDSRNIGAIMRSARAFGAAAIITTERHCPQENAMMLRAASGAAEHIPLIRVTNLARAMETLQDNGFVLAAMTARGDTPLSRLAEEDRLGLIMGAEGKGLRRLTLEHSDCHVSIDINPEAESLNVSTAAAIGLYAAGRRS
ncbi:MAG: 23S rRNA (guanosine(2251)-2'-O)-methyltransferase RlmB [Candidatus Puniceispirillales bacterium]